MEERCFFASFYSFSKHVRSSNQRAYSWCALITGLLSVFGALLAHHSSSLHLAVLKADVLLLLHRPRLPGEVCIILSTSAAVVDTNATSPCLAGSANDFIRKVQMRLLSKLDDLASIRKLQKLSRPASRSLFQSDLIDKRSASMATFDRLLPLHTIRDPRHRHLSFRMKRITNLHRSNDALSEHIAGDDHRTSHLTCSFRLERGMKPHLFAGCQSCSLSPSY